jgi:outer membrane protein
MRAAERAGRARRAGPAVSRSRPTVRRPRPAVRRAVLAAALLLLAPLAGRGEAGPLPLRLEEALRLAEQGSEAVRIRALQAAKSGAALQEARAQRLPRLGLEASASLLANPPEGITVHQGELGVITLPAPYGTMVIPDKDLVFVADAEPTYYKLGATLTQPLYTSGKITAGIRLAELDRTAAAAELERQRREIRRQTARAYYGAVFAGRSLPLLEAMRAAYRDVLADRRASFAEGTATWQAVLDAEASLASLEAKLVEAREARSSALESLAALTGLEAAGLDPGDGFRDACPDLDEESLRALAAAGSPDLELARARLEQAGVKGELERASAQLRPDLALSVEGSLWGQRTPFVGGDWTDTWDWNVVVSVGVKTSAFDSGASRARLRGAASDRAAAAAALSQAEKLLRLAVRAAVEAARGAGARLAERRARLALAEETEKNARVSLENGVATREQARLAEIGRLMAGLELESAGAALEDAIGDLEYHTGAALAAP